MTAREHRLQQLIEIIREAGNQVDQDIFIQTEPEQQAAPSRRQFWQTDALVQGEMIQEI